MIRKIKCLFLGHKWTIKRGRLVELMVCRVCKKERTKLTRERVGKWQK